MDRQVNAGVDVVNDGEMGKPGFISPPGSAASSARRRTPSRCGRNAREPRAFPEFYQAEIQTIDKRLRMQCVGPITYIGHDLMQEAFGFESLHWRENLTK